MARVVIAAHHVASYPEGGGHFWVYMQYVQGLRQLGCDVHWLEALPSTGDPGRDRRLRRRFLRRMQRFGMAGRTWLYQPGPRPTWLDVERGRAEAVLADADLLLNFHYGIAPDLLARFRRSALIDIDPGLLQFWMATGQLEVAPHDLYFSTGETVGTPAARFPDAGHRWLHLRPPVCLELWPYAHDPDARAFTTVSAWWGRDDWITDGSGLTYCNSKRESFLGLVDLPRRTPRTLELALCLDLSGPESGDAHDRRLLEERGWRVRLAREVAGSPGRYRRYLQSSRGELSAAKPSCVRFANAWVSDRTLCYLASGKPAVVQHTGRSTYLPDGLGLFRFHDVEGAAAALDAIDADYPKHCRAAREIAETCFDARRVLPPLLDTALAAP